jgi:hypothetical protein
MPDGIAYPETSQTRTTSALSRLGLRVRTRLRRRELDQQLALGADPSANAKLCLRAEQLQSTQVRERLADKLVGVLDRAHRPAPLTLRVEPHRAETRASASDLLDLASRLRSHRPVEVRGAAKAALLVTPGASPLDADRGGGGLRSAVRAARLALDPSAARARDRFSTDETEPGQSENRAAERAGQQAHAA